MAALAGAAAVASATPNLHVETRHQSPNTYVIECCVCCGSQTGDKTVTYQYNGFHAEEAPGCCASVAAFFKKYICCCFCSKESTDAEKERRRRDREAAREAVVQHSLTIQVGGAGGGGGGRAAAEKEADAILSVHDPDWARKADEGVPLRESDIEALQFASMRAVDEKVSALYDTVHARCPKDRGSTPDLFSGSTPIAEFLSELTLFVQERSGATHTVESRRDDVRGYLTEKGYPLSDRFLDMICTRVRLLNPHEEISEGNVRAISKLFEIALSSS